MAISSQCLAGGFREPGVTVSRPRDGLWQSALRRLRNACQKSLDKRFEDGEQCFLCADDGSIITMELFKRSDNSALHVVFTLLSLAKLMQKRFADQGARRTVAALFHACLEPPLLFAGKPNRDSRRALRPCHPAPKSKGQVGPNPNKSPVAATVRRCPTKRSQCLTARSTDSKVQRQAEAAPSLTFLYVPLPGFGLPESSGPLQMGRSVVAEWPLRSEMDAQKLRTRCNLPFRAESVAQRIRKADANQKFDRFAVRIALRQPLIFRQR